MGGTAEMTCNTVPSQFDPAEWMIHDNNLDIICQNEYWLQGYQTVGFCSDCEWYHLDICHL